MRHHYQEHQPTHSLEVDPSDHRQGKSAKTGCTAHINLVHQPSGVWLVTVVDLNHNHDCQLPPGGIAPRPASQAQRDLVNQYSSYGKFSHDHISKMLLDKFPDHPLEPRQVTNLINASRRDARQEIEALGGDVSAILASLREKADREHGWVFDLRLDENQTVIGLWWQSPTQAELTQRYHDILINDNTYNRNQYGYPLNIGIVVDNFGKSRNIWYAFHRTEDTATHTWIFQRHLESAGRPPEVVISDRHPSLSSSISQTMPTALHLYCLFHLKDNVTVNLHSTLGSEWQEFTQDFWVMYRAVSPEEFDCLWSHLVSRFPSAKDYLEEELYRHRERWAWAWISTVFTAGVRTNGRVEVENRINKSFGGPKKTLLQLFDALNDRTTEQTIRDMTQVKEVNTSWYALLIDVNADIFL